MRLCVGVDGGAVEVSTDPSSPSSTWASTTIDHAVEGCPLGHPACAAQLTAISCPSTMLCVAVDDAGNAFTSTNPTAVPSAWTSRLIDPTAGGIATTSFPNVVSCPSVLLCAAIDWNGGHVFASRNPTGSATAWPGTGLSGRAAMGISCPSPSLCVVVEDQGNIAVSTNPTGGVGAWRQTHIDGAHTLRAVSCTSTQICFAADDAGDVIVGTPLPSAPAMRALLRRLLTPVGDQAKIPALLRNHGYRRSVHVPSMGTLSISWLARVSSAKRPLLVASASARVAHSGTVKIRVRLTPRGDQLIRHATLLKLTAQVRFTPNGGASVTRRRTITLST